MKEHFMEEARGKKLELIWKLQSLRCDFSEEL